MSAYNELVRVFLQERARLGDKIPHDAQHLLVRAAERAADKAALDAIVALYEQMRTA